MWGKERCVLPSAPDSREYPSLVRRAAETQGHWPTKVPQTYLLLIPFYVGLPGINPIPVWPESNPAFWRVALNRLQSPVTRPKLSLTSIPGASPKGKPIIGRNCLFTPPLPFPWGFSPTLQSVNHLSKQTFPPVKCTRVLEHYSSAGNEKVNKKKPWTCSLFCLKRLCFKEVKTKIFQSLHCFELGQCSKWSCCAHSRMQKRGDYGAIPEGGPITMI